MDGVVEVGVVRQAVNLHPWDRLARLPALADGGEARAVAEDLALTMAVDAGLGVGEIGVAGNLDEAMAVAAVHSKLLHVKSVGEGDRLVRLVAHAGVLGGEVVPDPESHGRPCEEDADKQLERYPVGPSGKEIRHREW